MIPIITKAVIIFLILTVVYGVFSVVSRIQARDRLKSEYDEAERDVGKADYVADGLAEHNKKTRRKLMLRIYIVPFVIALILIWLAHTGA